MAEILTLCGILDICARNNGKSTTIIEDCKDHILIGHGLLFVVTYPKNVKRLTDEIFSHINQCGFYAYVKHCSIGYIDGTNGSAIRIIDANQLLSESAFRGVSISDILFDCPDIIFDNKILELSRCLAR